MATAQGPLTNSRKKTWEMMVNPDVDSYDKTLNHWKIIREKQKNNNLLKTKRMLKPKYHLRWWFDFHI